MIKADTHVHSRYSEHPSEWFLQKLGTRESYTTIDEIYEAAMMRGMDFVTVTDHNQIRGALELVGKYPNNTFTGVESTTYFPEDGCKIHVCVYGLTEKQFSEIERIRTNIYDFREYLKEQQLAHTVAHATFNVNKKLTPDNFYKLLLLFDVFETANGARTKRANNDLMRLLTRLTPDHFTMLRKRYAIEPFSDEPWVKGFTGGSDDHSGLQIARTFTSVREASSPDAFLGAIMRKQSFSRGAHNDYKRFTFNIYKIAYDFSKQKSASIPATILSTLNRMIFEGEGLGFRNKLALRKVRAKGASGKGNDFHAILADLFEAIEEIRNEPVERKLDVVYDKLGKLSDEICRTFLDSVSAGISGADMYTLFKSVSGVLPVAFLTLPFLSTINLLNESRLLQDTLDRELAIAGKRSGRRVLWFTDTITDLNGPSETIQKCAWLAFYRDLDLTPVVSMLPEEKRGMLPPNVLDLPPVWSYTPEFFSLYTFRLPSILASIKLICEEEPDEIIISTPGPLGLLGLLCARLLHIPCRGIYHTDFTEQLQLIIGDDSVSRILEEYVRWFYQQCDIIKVPTKEYIRILSRRGYTPEKMSVFPRGIEPDLFLPREDAREELGELYGIRPDCINLLYVGRISAEKQVNVILDVYEEVVKKYDRVNLLFAGSGPEPFFSDYKKRMENRPGVYFLGRIDRNRLPVLYSGSDLMLFPSTTDTFGMAVLEAQACGLPVIVSDVGGPQEIVIDEVTGFVIPVQEKERWIGKVTAVIDEINLFPERHHEMKHAARAHVLSVYNWQYVLDDIFGTDAAELHDDEKESARTAKNGKDRAADMLLSR